MDRHQELDNIADDFALITADQAGDNVLPIELTNTTGTCIQQLNTHCLMQIFSINSLTLTDLCSIAETCTRFKEIAEQIFPEDLNVSFDYYTNRRYQLKSKKYGEYLCSMPPVERILKNFGPYISSVSIRKCDKLVNLVAKYCGTATLERLDIQSLDIGQGKGLTMKLKTVLQRMLALSVYNCNLMTLVTCPYINCDSLIELEITSSSGCANILRSTFPKLEIFTFYENFMFSKHNDRKNQPYSEILPNFLRRHKRLTTLHLSSDSVYCSSQLMETIANNCTELTNLSLKRWHSPKTSFNFSNLKNLRKLIMLDVRLGQTDHRQVIAVLEVLKSLTTLKLTWIDEAEPQIFIVLSQLPNLRELHLKYGDMEHIPWSMLTQLKVLYIDEVEGEYVGHHIPHIISELTNLEELVYTKFPAYGHESNHFRLSSEAYSEIVKIVEGRPNKLILRCRLSKDLAKNYAFHKNVNLIEYTDSD